MYASFDALRGDLKQRNRHTAPAVRAPLFAGTVRYRRARLSALAGGGPFGGGSGTVAVEGGGRVDANFALAPRFAAFASGGAITRLSRSASSWAGLSVAIDLQEPRVWLEEVEHARLVLRRVDNRLHGQRWDYLARLLEAPEARF